MASHSTHMCPSLRSTCFLILFHLAVLCARSCDFTILVLASTGCITHLVLPGNASSAQPGNAHILIRGIRSFYLALDIYARVEYDLAMPTTTNKEPIMTSIAFGIINATDRLICAVARELAFQLGLLDR